MEILVRVVFPPLFHYPQDQCLRFYHSTVSFCFSECYVHVTKLKTKVPVMTALFLGLRIPASGSTSRAGHKFCDRAM